MTNVFAEFDPEALDSILLGKQDIYTTSVTISAQAWMLMMAPIQYDDQITGAILSVHRVDEGMGRY